MVAEVLAGIALVSSAVKGIKSSIEAAKDINDIASSIDDLMTGAEQCQKKAKVQQKSGQAGKWQNYLRLRFTSQKETGDGTSIQEVAAEVIEQKHAERELWQMQLLINRKFGANTWADIMIMRDQRIEELEKKRNKMKHLAKLKKEEDARLLKKFFKEAGNVIVLLGVVSGVGYFIWYLSERS